MGNMKTETKNETPKSQVATPAPDTLENRNPLPVIDTSKEAVGEYLKKAADDLNAEGGAELPQGQRAGRLAFLRFVCTVMNVTDDDVKWHAWVQIEKTPAWFGSNTSSAAQALGWREEGSAKPVKPSVKKGKI